MKSNENNIYSAAIIGAGRIASGFDTPRSRVVLTHAHAIVSSKRLKLAGITDIDEVRGKRESLKWKTDYYSDTRSMLKMVKPDIVVIATPDETHAGILLRILRTRPRLVICEKPVATNTKDIRRIGHDVKKSGAQIIVNYRRRFDPSVRAVQMDIRSGRFGKVISASAHYVKGILHNGAHAIDLARYLFGEMLSSKAHFTVNDFPEGSLSVGGVATFEKCPQFHLITGDERNISLFEFDIILEKKRLRFVDEGFSLVSQDVVPDPVFRGFRTLGKETMRKTGLVDSMPLLMENAVAVLDGKERSISPIEEALKTVSACLKLKEGI